MIHFVNFLGKHIVNQGHYVVQAYADLEGYKDDYLKFDVIIKKQNNVFIIDSVGNFKIKLKKEKSNYLLNWTSTTVSKKIEQKIYHFLTDNQDLTDMIKEGKWIVSTLDLTTLDEVPFPHHKIQENVYGIKVNVEAMIHSNYSVSYQVNICEFGGMSGSLFIDRICLTADLQAYSKDPTKKSKLRKDTYLGQFLMNEVLQSLHNKVRPTRILMDR